MPTYQYKCRQCDHRLEAIQSFTDEPLTECPVCEGPLRKVFSSVGVVFKGTGFYRNDSRKVSANGKSDEAAASAESSGSKSDSKSDAKSEGKTDAKSGAKSDGKTGSGSGTKSETKPSSTSTPSTATKSA